MSTATPSPTSDPPSTPPPPPLNTKPPPPLPLPPTEDTAHALLSSIKPPLPAPTAQCLLTFHLFTQCPCRPGGCWSLVVQTCALHTLPSSIPRLTKNPLKTLLAICKLHRIFRVNHYGANDVRLCALCAFQEGVAEGSSKVALGKLRCKAFGFTGWHVMTEEERGGFAEYEGEVLELLERAVQVLVPGGKMG